MNKLNLSYRNYLLVMTVSFAGLAASFCILVIVGSFRPADCNDNLNSRWIHFYRSKKIAAAEMILSPKTVTVGGSTGFYDVDSTILSQYLGRPTLNYSLHAGLTLEYILYDARRVLKKGDTALLLLEYTHYSLNGDVTAEEADYVLTHDTSFLLKISPRKTVKMLALLSPRDWLQLIKRGVSVTPDDDLSYKNSIGPSGDITLNTDEAAKKKLLQISAYKADPFPNPIVTPHARKQLTDFLKWAKSNGIKVIAAYPPYMRFKEYETGKFPLLVENIRSFYTNEDIKIIGNAYQHLYPRNAFFDTNCHLKASARTQFSNLLGQEIQASLVK